MSEIMKDYLKMIQDVSKTGRYEVIVKDFVYKGFDCSAVRTSMGHWCGYVCIPKDNALYGKNYDECNIDCHGGLTYSDYLHHVGGINTGKYALGFDFAHYNDTGGSLEQVIFECQSIIEQMTNQEKSQA